jgi:hypothetical protein
VVSKDTLLTIDEFWADFVKNAVIQDPGVNDDVFVPYVLVHSPSQEKLNRTERIEALVKTEFNSATWGQLKGAFLTFYDADPRIVMPVIFLILDEQSSSDRMVVVIEKGAEWVLPEGAATEVDRTKLTVWRKYRVPFEEAFSVQCGIEGFCTKEIAEEYFVEDLEREVCIEEETDEESEETDSDETTSEDLEYGDFPLNSKPK